MMRLGAESMPYSQPHYMSPEHHAWFRQGKRIFTGALRVFRRVGASYKGLASLSSKKDRQRC
jgi:hypothetical protein